MTQHICPWCHMEIIWDDEYGPEEECPYCFNELHDYRTLDVEMVNALDEDTDEFDLEKGIERYLQFQEDALDCEQCQEKMITAGEQHMDGIPSFPGKAYGLVPLLNESYTIHVYICPTCFQVKYSLNEESRLRVMNVIRGMGQIK